MQSGGGMVLRRRSTPPLAKDASSPNSAVPPRKRVSLLKSKSNVILNGESKAKKLRPSLERLPKEEAKKAAEAAPKEVVKKEVAKKDVVKKDVAKKEVLTPVVAVRRSRRSRSNTPVANASPILSNNSRKRPKAGVNVNPASDDKEPKLKKETEKEAEAKESEEEETHTKEETTSLILNTTHKDEKLMHLDEEKEESSQKEKQDEDLTFVPQDTEDPLVHQKKVDPEEKKTLEEEKPLKSEVDHSIIASSVNELVNGDASVKDPESTSSDPVKDEETTPGPNALHVLHPNSFADISDGLSPTYDSNLEVEDMILKEYEESQLEEKPRVFMPLINPHKPIHHEPEPIIQEASIPKAKQQRGPKSKNGEVSSPVKRLLRSKTTMSPRVPPKQQEPTMKKQVAKGRKPRGKNTKRVPKKNNGSSSNKSSLSKVKSSLDQENSMASDHSSEEPLVPLKGGNKSLISECTQKDDPMDLKMPEAVRQEINERLESFEHIKENVFLCARRSNKQSRGMECDCSLTKEEMSSNRRGCGENCLNRLLKIECSKLCSLGKLCGNKKFQNSDNAPVEVFKTSCKGFGVRATSNIPGDTFIMEYVGEVLDAKQFRKRAKRYAKDDVRHFYFMALSTEFCIDAGSKGNISRFINHSCSPNSETQKWMVDGEMRIGFFTKRRISCGEELTFDYKYERYGQEAQKCLCEAENCRGWLGGEPGKDEEDDLDQDDDDEDDYWSTSEEEEAEGIEASSEDPLISAAVVVDPLPPPEECEVEEDKDYVVLASSSLPDDEEPSKEESCTPLPPAVKRRRRRRRSPRKIKNYEDAEDEDEIERLKSTGIRTKNHTVELSRIMVRTTDTNSRSELAELLLNADKPCKRLFLDYYGLKILYGWMSENIWSNLHELDLKIQILNILALLGIPHKTMLVDCKVWAIVKDWANGDLGVEDNSRSGSTSPDRLSEQIAESCNDSEVPRQSTEGVVVETPRQSIEDIEPPGQKAEGSQNEEEALPPPVFTPNAAEEEENKTEGLVVPGEAEKVIIEEPCKDKEELQKTLSEQPPLKEEVFETDIKPIRQVEAPEEDSGVKSMEEIDSRLQVIVSKSKELIIAWESLKEVFKIPKKDRLALRAEHEREADQAAAGHPPSSTAATPARGSISTVTNPCILQNGVVAPSSGSSSQKIGGYFTPTPLPGRPCEPPPQQASHKRLCSRWDDRSGRLHRSKLSREERRQLFALQVKTQEEEKRKRELLLEHHRNKCFYLNLPPDETPLFPHYPDFVFNPEDGHWYQMPEPYPKIPQHVGYADMAENLPQEAYREGDEPLPNRAYLYPPGVVPVSYLYGIPLTTPEDYYKQLAIQQQMEVVLQREEQINSEESSSSRLSSTCKLKRPDEAPVLEEEPALLHPSYSPTPFSLPPPKEPPEDLTSEADDSNKRDPQLPPASISTLKEEVKPTSLCSTASAPLREVTIRLPRGWKSASDPQGRIYYYNASAQIAQWDPPPSSSSSDEGCEDDPSVVVIECETLSSDSEEDGDDSEEDEEDDSESEESNVPPKEEGASDLSDKEKEILLNLPGKKKTKEERQHERRQKRERDREKREYERKRRRERHGKHRRDGLVVEFFIPGRSDSEKREVAAMKGGSQHVLRDKNSSSYPPLPLPLPVGDIPSNSRTGDKKSISGGEGSSHLGASSSSSSTAMGGALPSSQDSEKEKKYKDRFLKEASKVIVKVLDPYRRSDVPCGQIKSVEDFKHLARKLTNFVMTKELKHCPKIEDLKCSESVKKKAAEFVKKYMSKFGDVYKRSPTTGM